MAKKKKLIPFWLLPASWGLSGDSKKVAEVEYYYEGDELQYELIRIKSKNEKDFQLSKLAYDLDNENITEFEHNKKRAEINDEPWVDVKKIDVNPENAKAGYMELDWNDQFVKMLQSNGYTGTSDEDVVNKWFNDVCRTVLLQEAQDMDFGLESSENNIDVVTIKDDPNDSGN